MLTDRCDGLLPASDPGPSLMLRCLLVPGTDPAALVREAWAAGLDLATTYKWKLPAGHEMIRRLAQIAVHSVLTGVTLSAQGAAEHCGITQAEWLDEWADRYGCIHHKVQEWRQVAVMSLAPALGWETKGVAP